MSKFENVIKKYLDEFANESPEFKEAYSKENKSIERCCAYILQEMRKLADNRSAIVTDDEVYYLARHYYEEDDLNVEHNGLNFAFVHTVPELSEEDKRMLKKQALDEFLAKERKMLEDFNNNKKNKQKEKKESQEQISLFDDD